MKQNLTTWLLLFSLCSIFTSCKKDNTIWEEQLPPETQTGAYTLGFKADGVIFKAGGKGSFLSSTYVSGRYDSRDSSIYISAKSSWSDRDFDFTMEFKCSTFYAPCLLMTNYPYGVSFHDRSKETTIGAAGYYRSNNNFPGTATVKYFNRTGGPGNSGTIMSGTFQMDCVNEDGKVIKITEGRFDIGP